MRKDYLFLHKIQHMNLDEIIKIYIESQTGIESIEHPKEIKETLEKLAGYILKLEHQSKEVKPIF